MIYMCVGIVNLSKQVRTIFLSVTSFVLIIFFMFCKKKKVICFSSFQNSFHFFLLMCTQKQKQKETSSCVIAYKILEFIYSNNFSIFLLVYCNKFIPSIASVFFSCTFANHHFSNFIDTKNPFEYDKIFRFI